MQARVQGKEHKDFLTYIYYDWVSKFGNYFDSRVTTISCKPFSLVSFLMADN